MSVAAAFPTRELQRQVMRLQMLTIARMTVVWRSTPGFARGSQYGLTWDMVDWDGWMLDIPRTKNEEAIHVPLNDAATAALKVVHARGGGNGHVFQSEKTGEPLENGRHWFDDAVIEAGAKNFRWHGLATHVCEPAADERDSALKTLQICRGTRV